MARLIQLTVGVITTVLQRTVSENVGVSDTQLATLVRSRAITDNVGVSDSHSPVLTSGSNAIPRTIPFTVGD